MLKTLGIVDACFMTPSSRTRAGRRIGGKSVLEWVVRRATECQQLNGVIVITTREAENDFIARLVPRDVPVFSADKTDVLACFAAAVEEYPCESVVRFGVDYPFIDPMLVDRLVVTADARSDCDYVGYGLRDGRLASLSPVGVCGEWFRSMALHKAHQKAKSSDERSSATRYLSSHPDRFRLELIPAPEQIDRDDVRLTVDVDEDWEHALAIFEALGPDELDWRRITNLLDHQPGLRRRMAAINRERAGI